MRKTKNLRASDQKLVEIKCLSQEYTLYSNPIILLMNFRGGKRAEAAQWSLEIQKMLRGIFKSIRILEGVMNQAHAGNKLNIDNEEIEMPAEESFWLMLYLIDNAILRIYASLDKIAQMVRCYLEHPTDVGTIEAIAKCGCREQMTENNCNFGKLLQYLHTIKGRHKEITDSLKKLETNKSIQELRTYRNAFTHKKHTSDTSMGLDPIIKASYCKDGSISTMFSFGDELPSVNWFRIEIVNANNAIVECVEHIGSIIFPRDFGIASKNVE